MSSELGVWGLGIGFWGLGIFLETVPECSRRERIEGWFLSASESRIENFSGFRISEAEFRILNREIDYPLCLICNPIKKFRMI